MDGDIIDAENYRSNDEGYGYKDLVMRQFQKVLTAMSQEMREGITVYSDTKLREGQVTKYFPDTRKQLIQCIDCLHDLLQPRFDELMKEDSAEILRGIEELREEASSETEYWKKKLKSYRGLFQSLCHFLERLGWLEAQSFDE